jgi:hypothetical protein
MELDDLREVIDHLIGEGPGAFVDPGAMAGLERQLSRLEAYVAVSADAFEQAGHWSESGARNGVAWLATTTHLPKKVLARQVRLGRHLHQVTRVKESWLCGEISGSHVDAVVRVMRPLTKDLLARDEEMLVKEATRCRFEDFLRLMGYWELHANPDGSDEAAQDQRDRRDAYLEPSFAGMWLGKMTLDPIAGAIVSGEHKRIEAEFFASDCQAAKETLGRTPRLDELARTPAQRRADAFVEMAIRSASAPTDARRPSPLFSVFVGWESLHGRLLELAQGVPLNPGSLLPWLEEADLERAVFQPKGRVEISERSRFFTGATRRALELRDRECTHPFCDVRAERCQADHVQEWGQGGLTYQANGRLLCGFHNRLRNHSPPPRE